MNLMTASVAFAPVASAPDSLSPALERVLERFGGIVRRVCWKYRFTGAEVDELMQEVRIGVRRRRAGGAGHPVDSRLPPRGGQDVPRERIDTLEHVMACAACHREYAWLAAVHEAAVEAGRAPALHLHP
jgi:hypothetical protein